MKSVLISIQPYWVFLIIARLMGWNIPQEKTVEVRKDYPKASDWDRVTHIYCSKNRKSFNRIPKEYQPFMEKFLGKVIGEFVCDRLDATYPILIPNTDEALYTNEWVLGSKVEDTCLTLKDISEYGKGKPLYGWHISDLKIYDKPKGLGEFFTRKVFINIYIDKQITRPPQSWCYVEEL